MTLANLAQFPLTIDFLSSHKAFPSVPYQYENQRVERGRTQVDGAMSTGIKGWRLRLEFIFVNGSVTIECRLSMREVNTIRHDFAVAGRKCRY